MPASTIRPSSRPSATGRGPGQPLGLRRRQAGHRALHVQRALQEEDRRRRSRRRVGARLQGFLALADAINRAGSTDPAKIRDALKATDLKADQMVTGYRRREVRRQGPERPGLEPRHPDARRQVPRDLAQGARHRRARPARTRAGSGTSAYRARVARQPSGRHVLTLVQVIVGGLLLGAVYALFSSGLTLIWGMMNVVNFAHGDFVMLGMYAAVMVWTALGGGPFAAVPIAAMLIATLGVRRATSCWCATSCAGRCWRRSWAPSGWRCSCATPPSGPSAPTSRPCPTRWSAAPSCSWASASRARACWPASAALLSRSLLHLILTRTAVGSRMLAVSEDATAAQLMGIRPQRMQALAWAMAARRHRHRRRAYRHLLLHLAHGRRDARPSSPSSLSRSAASAACWARWWPA